MDTPTHRAYNKRVHEWAIGVPCDAKTFAYNVEMIRRQMEELGVDLSYDDAYRVTTVDEEIVFSLEWTD